VLTWPCAGENGGKKKRGVGRCGAHFKGGQRRGGKEGGSGQGRHAAGNGRNGFRPDGGGGRPAPTLERQVRAVRCAARGLAMPRSRREIREPGEAEVWASATVPHDLAVYSVQTKFNEFK
jgi:hypothetical protein